MLQMLNDNDTAKMIAPIVGAVGGTLILPRVAEQIGMPTDQVAIAGALVALTIANGAEGAMKGALSGVAAAGVCLGIREFLELRRPKPKPEPAPMPPNAISRDDFHKAVDELRAQLAEQAREREAQQVQSKRQLRELQDMVRDLVARLKDAHAEIDRLHREAAQRTARDADASRLEMQPPNSESVEVVSPVDFTSSAVDENPPVPTEIEVPADELDAMQAVYALLDDEERQQLSTMVANLPPEDAQQLRTRFASANPHDVAATVRAYLSSVTRAHDQYGSASTSDVGHA